jgi:hypothetical protein
MGCAIGLLGGSRDPDQGDGVGVTQDAGRDFVQLGGRQSEDRWGHSHDHVPFGEHLAGRQRPVRSQHVLGYRTQRSVAEELVPVVVLALVIEAGLFDVGHQLLGREAGSGQFGPPPRHQLVDRGVALGLPRLPGRHLAGLVGGEALLGHGMADLGGALGVDRQGGVGDATDLPVPELAGWTGIGLDAVAELDRCGGRSHSADHGGRVEVLPPQGGVGSFRAGLCVQHLDHVGDQHVVVGPRIAGPGGGMAGVGVDEAGGGGRDRSHASASAACSGQVVQIAQCGVPLGVHDGVHILCPAEHSELGDGLVGGDEQLHARAPGGDHSLARPRVTGPAGSVDRVVGGVVDRTDQAEGFGTRSAPEQRGLAARGVVLEGGPREVVAALDDGHAVVGDRVRSHHLHPGHTDSLSPARGTPCNHVQGIQRV